VDSELNAVRCELAGEVLRSSARLRLRVTGWSMLPSVWPGDILLVEPTSANEIFEGDIVLFGRSRRLFVHRVVSKGPWQNGEIVTRGDAMPTPDPPLSERDLLGRVSSILRNGKTIQPRRRLRLSEQAVAALVRRSTFAARLVVGLQGLHTRFRSSLVQALKVQTSQLQTK
jgi:signal peptidase I